MKARAWSQTKDRRALLVVGTGSSASSSVSPAVQLSANSSLDSIKVLHSLATSSLCKLCGLCVSVVNRFSDYNNHRDTENTENAQRRSKIDYLITPIAVALFRSCGAGNSSLTTRPGNFLNPLSHSSGTGVLSSRKFPVNANSVGTKLRLS